MGRLAINGGSPEVPGGLSLGTWPVFGDEERQGLLEVLEGGNWCLPPEGKVVEFQRRFAAWIGTAYATACHTGTDALELAFRSCDLDPGDEVIVPAVTFLASASAVVLAGGVPVFVDIDPETYQISPEAIEAAITPRTVAIEPVHYSGYPADMDRVLDIARRHDLFVVEDCAEAHGTEWRGRRVGSLGDMGCFSFQMGKTLTCGEGGAVTYSDEALAMSCYACSRFGQRPGGGRYEHHQPAGNHRMSEFLGAILLPQLARLETQTAVRHRHGAELDAALAAIEGIQPLRFDSRITSRAYYFYLFRYCEAQWGGVPRDRFMAALRAEGVECGTAHNDPVYLYPAFQNIKRSLMHGNPMDYRQVCCPEAERVYRSEVVAMGNRFMMDGDNVGRIVGAVAKLRRHLGELAQTTTD